MKCKICDNEQNFKFLFSCRDYRYTTSNEVFSLWLCPNCRIIFVYPFPSKEKIASFYTQDNYFDFKKFKADTGIKNEPLHHKIAGTIRNFLIKLDDNIINYNKRGKVLEVGCGIGDTLYKFKSKGWEVYGIDFSPLAQKIGRDIFGIDIFCSDFETYEFKEAEYFDLILMFHFLEHVSSPVRVINKVWKLLKKDGELIIEVPNFNSFTRKIFGKFWNNLEVPRHIFHFSSDSIEFLLKTNKFYIEKIYYKKSHFGFVNSINRILKYKGLFAIPSTINYFFAPISVFLSTLKLSDFILVKAKKVQ